MSGLGAAPAAATPSRRRSAALVGLCALAYLYVFPYQAPINNPNENVRFYMTAALVEEGTYAIDSVRERWGWVNDAAVRDGRVYSVKAPGTSLLGVPPYALYYMFTRLTGGALDRTVALWCVRVGGSILPTLLWLWYVHRFFGRYTRSATLRDCALLSVALGSLLYAYGLLFVSHTLSAACAFGAFMIWSRAPDDISPRLAALGGLLTAGVTLFEYPGLIASLALAGYGLARLGRRKLPWIALGGALPTLAMMHFQYAAFGSPFTPGHRYLENPAYRALSQQGFFGAGGFQLEALQGLLLDPGYGLLPLTPLLWAAPAGFALGLRARRERAGTLVSLALCTLTVIAICLMNNWRGGWTVGPRYLAVVVPFFAWAALTGLDHGWRRAPDLADGLALGATAAGLVLSGAPSAYYPHLPEAITRPIPDLIVPLVRYDFAPLNAGNLLGVFGSASMAPLAAIALTALGYAAWPALQRARGWRRLTLSLLALGSAALFAYPALGGGSGTAAARRALGFITERWHPAGHDALSALKALPPAARPPNWEQEVIHLHRRLGQDRALARWQRARAARAPPGEHP